MPDTIHATLVQLSSFGVLLRGPSNSGKSSIALRILDEAEQSRAQCHLIADDQVILASNADRLFGKAPDNLFGKIEMRGVGIINVEARRECRVDLVVDLVPLQSLERMPDEKLDYVTIAGVDIRRIYIAERNPDASAIIRTLLKAFPQANKSPLDFA
ncbi:MAG: HPr kinase/phosphatase C-terminal domain-containing protein [Hyphomicrobiales bacterium]